MKKRILRDPNTGEIIGATKAPFLKAKLEEEYNEELRKKEGESGGGLTNDEAFSKNRQPASSNTYETTFQPTTASRAKENFDIGSSLDKPVGSSKTTWILVCVVIILLIIIATLI
tara:strand:- start:208 stop:552 length:345 start_codon:yes stop_codon:yes gene_type:complete